MASTEQKMSRMQLTAMVVGGMVGAGIFSLPRTFANATGPFGAVIAWLIAGTGMYMLARVFQSLAERKPDLDAGVFAYFSPPSATGSAAALATSRTGC
jgi:arginine:ornithine antiporter / lysine permease